ncbi:MAG: V-type ATPase subunit, partial [Oscillospiraceae bacterium]
MLETFSENAVTAKIRSLYGKRITPSQLADLCYKNNNSEVITFLKNHPSYKNALEGVSEETEFVHLIEDILNKEIFTVYSKLLRYVPKKNTAFFKHVIMTSEIYQLSEITKLIAFNKEENYIREMPTFLKEFASFDITSLAKVRSFDELLKTIEHTDYYKTMKKVPCDKDNIPNYIFCERLLRQYYFSRVKKLIEENYKGKTKDQLFDIFGTQAELENINAIYRMKKYYEIPEAEMLDLLIDFNSRLSKKHIEDLVKAHYAEDILTFMEQSKFKKYFDKQNFMFIEYSS